MKKLDVNYRPGRDYRELFDVAINNGRCTVSSIGITNAGELIRLFRADEQQQRVLDGL